VCIFQRFFHFEIGEGKKSKKKNRCNKLETRAKKFEQVASRTQFSDNRNVRRCADSNQLNNVGVAQLSGSEKISKSVFPFTKVGPMDVNNPLERGALANGLSDCGIG
jgi:hypothetical protein